MREVTFWFDFLSPYSWLAFDRAHEFAAEHQIIWRLRPIVFGAILDATGLVGPGEVRSKRDGAMRDVEIQARDRGLTFVGPPAHPFRSLDALRAACLFQDRPPMFDVCRALFAAAWELGRDLTDRIEIASALERAGHPVENLAAAIQDPAIKQCLRTNTEQAIARGVYGVPTFDAAGELFWGQDRMAHVGRAVTGSLPEPSEALRSMLQRPIAQGRRNAPGSGR
ncbi:MAG: 2-hydroxychromene-2-carboxylate isomerase [Planctomycetes bacterium]|nr:2-hydroxychromene-2-carboxylate isomerase [Planctomycetota bacterium]